MKITDKILYILIIFFTFIMPVIPSTFQIKHIFLTGDTILYIIILYFLLILILNRYGKKSLIGNYRKMFKDPVNIFMLLWITAMFISVIYAKDRELAFSESIRFSSYVFLFFIIKYYINEEKIYRWILNSYLFTSFIIGIYSIYQKIMGTGLIESSKFGREIRISSFLENANNLGMYSVFIIFPLIILSIKEKRLKIKFIYLILTAMASVNLILSYSRNAFIGFAIGISIFMFMYGIKYIILVILPIILACFVPAISSRIMDISDTSKNLSRIKLWKIAVYIIRDNPVLGVGNGNYTCYYPVYKNRVAYIDYTPLGSVHPHNMFLKAYTELGLLGIISFSGLIISSFMAVYRFIKVKKDNFYGWFYKGIFISLFSFLFMNSIDNFFNAPKVIVYYFITLAVCEGLRIRKLA